MFMTHSNRHNSSWKNGFPYSPDNCRILPGRRCGNRQNPSEQTPAQQKSNRYIMTIHAERCFRDHYCTKHTCKTFQKSFLKVHGSRSFPSHIVCALHLQEMFSYDGIFFLEHWNIGTLEHWKQPCQKETL